MTEWLTLLDAAKLIRRDLRTLQRWVDAGMPTIVINRARYVERSALVGWAANHGRRRGRTREDP